ncbi:restriction endonuclease subunit S [Corynebacterium sp. KPL2830]|uniref:restriction endonuclease subunit S n=1 Tax=Corynebacterium sp. KPL2830 TaxID=3158315 RepID=UPI0032EEB830
MKTLKQLIDRYCPNGVEYVQLGDVVTIKNGSDWKRQEPGDIAVYGSGGKMLPTVKTPASSEPSVLLPRKGTLEVQFVDVPFWNIDTAFRTETNPSRLSMKYFYYSMKGFDFSEISTSATRPSLTQTALKRLKLPLPPREIQDKIVEHLDTFAALCENLDLEISQREKQFAEYREKMLSADYLTSRYCSEGVDYVRLGDVATVRNGWGFPTNFQGGRVGVPFFKVADMNRPENKVRMNLSSNYVDRSTLNLIKARTSPAGTLIFPKIGAAVATNKKRLLVEESSYDNNVAGVIPGDSLNPSFLFYYFLGFDLSSIALQSGATPSIRKSSIENVTVPLPSREVQNEITAKLDAMQELIDNLRLEREQRQQQFDYYREKLLSFPKKETNEV